MSLCGVIPGLVNEEECRAKVMALQPLGVTIVEDEGSTPLFWRVELVFQILLATEIGRINQIMFYV